jgi:hypothetical protein
VRALPFLALSCLACGPRPPTTTIDFPRSEAAILNPERGLVTDIDLVAGRDFAYVRAQGYTLGYAGVRLDAYRADALPTSLLDALTAGFAAVRDAGIKVVLRFVYNDAPDGVDAPREVILVHLAQLERVLDANADVIAVMDAGFIGAWGEWHSSTNGLDNELDRQAILAAILEALPVSRSTTVRSPFYKRGGFAGPISEAHAHDGSPPARIGHHNSCFLASDNDLGTYPEPIETWKDLVAQDGRFTPVGGETCQPNPPRTDCATATAELRRLHWSFLNSLYHLDVLAAWQAQGCYAEIARDLGYRLELDSVTLDEKVAPGGSLQVTIRLRNTGYAAMYNARPVYLTLDDAAVELPVDPRRWEPGALATIHARVRIPAGTAPGRHRLGLWLPDADPRLREPARVGFYAVRLANARWEASINVLTDDVIVDAMAPGPVDTRATELVLLP